MQIREQGQQVQLIRSPYDSTKKRCVQKVAHTFKRQYNYLSDDINKYLSAEQVSDLSDDEKKHLSDWLKVRSDTNASDDRKHKISYADKYLTLAADAISSDGVDSVQALKIWDAIERLSRALKKSGNPKSATKPVKAPTAPTAPAGQVGLDLETSSSLLPGESA